MRMFTKTGIIAGQFEIAPPGSYQSASKAEWMQYGHSQWGTILYSDENNL